MRRKRGSRVAASQRGRTCASCACVIFFSSRAFMMFVFNSLDTFSSARAASVGVSAARLDDTARAAQSRAAPRRAASGRARCSSSVSASSLDVFLLGPCALLALEPAATAEARKRRESAPQPARRSPRRAPAHATRGVEAQMRAPERAGRSRSGAQR